MKTREIGIIPILTDLILNHLFPIVSVSYQIRLKYLVYFLVSLDYDFDGVGSVSNSLVKGLLKRIWINTAHIKQDILISGVLMSTNWNFDDKFTTFTWF